jgi:LmbE family N-acetylglucosaminyl deacetylase
MKIRLIPLFVFLVLLPLRAQVTSQAPALLPPDARTKADVLVVIAHCDDDVILAGYLARLTLDEHKRVAVIYVTNGDGGGNSVGNEAGAALGQERQMEARHALASIGIENLWFLGFHDTPSQNALYSLDNWNHGTALDGLVRLVRLTRPDVILTWLPAPVAGENHGDHQGSAVLAVEAFDAAGDPTRFPEQVAPARDRTGMSNLTEGLLPWQPQKLYFFTDAFEVFSPYWHDEQEFSPFRKNLGDGNGPSYDMSTISPTRHKSYGEIMAEEQAFYMTQEGQLGVDALKAKRFTDFEYPLHLIFGKSLVEGSVTGDVFEGVKPAGVPFRAVHGYEPGHEPALSLQIGDPWRFYSLFWKAHDLNGIAGLIPIPEMAADLGENLQIPLLVCNGTQINAQVTVSASLPAGWTNNTAFTRYPVHAGECYPMAAKVAAPPSGKSGWQEITWTASADERNVGSVKVRIYVGRVGGLPR